MMKSQDKANSLLAEFDMDMDTKVAALARANGTAAQHVALLDQLLAERRALADQVGADDDQYEPWTRERQTAMEQRHTSQLQRMSEEGEAPETIAQHRKKFADDRTYGLGLLKRGRWQVSSGSGYHSNVAASYREYADGVKSVLDRFQAGRS
jgi:hypothetical protein